MDSIDTNRKTRNRVTKTIPRVDRELANYLMDKYPEVIPSPTTTIEEIMKQAGKRELVKRLWEMAYESD